MKEYNRELRSSIENFDVELAEEIIEKQLELDNNNVNLWVKLAVTVLCVPLVDYGKSLECIDKVNSLEENNIFSTLLESCIYRYHLSGIDERLLNKLDSITTNDDELLSMTKYLMSVHYQDTNVNMQMKLLEESIRLCNNHVSNYEELGKLYIRGGNLSKGQELLKKAYDNIVFVYNDESLYDFTDVNEYLLEYVKGTHVSSANKVRLRELIGTL